MHSNLRSLHQVVSVRSSLFIGLALLLAMSGFFFTGSVFADDHTAGNDERLVTIHDGGNELTIITKASTIRGALEQAAITLETHDIVEPSLDETLTAKTYQVNVFRARPVIIDDGSHSVRVVSAEQSPKKLAEAAAVPLYDEDDTATERVDDMLYEGGAGEKLVIDRATVFELTLYGTTFTARSQTATVGDMLKEKGITLGEKDGVAPTSDTPLISGMNVRIWRDGKQTVTQEVAIPKPIEEIKDLDKALGYRAVQTAGSDGKRNVTFEIETKDGVEVARKEIASVTTREPVKEVVVVGTKAPSGGLTKSKGVYQFTDSSGVTHRETYYDLPMSVVMRNCGAQGYYTTRADGVKVDSEGYVIIAAQLSRYPRCSVVETSLGPGKVYDTGSFTAVHPDGFDLATDWSNNDGI